MKFSHDGARLVSGGQDAILRVWKVQISSEEDAKVARESDEKQILDAEPERSYQVRLRIEPLKLLELVSTQN